MRSLRESLHRARPASRACAAAILAGLLATYVFSLLTPTLLAHHALLLEALSGNVASIVIGGAEARTGHAPLVLVLLAPLVGIVLYDVALWWAGRLWGNEVLSRFVRTPRARRRLARTEAWVARRGVVALAVAYFLPLPNPATYLLCGASGMTLAVFTIGDVVGTLLWTTVLVGLGWAIGRPALRLLHTFDHYSLAVTVAVLVILLAVRAVRRGT
ncbi:MAG: rane-associated protein-like protein [Frankiales bacterium]|nr:rane-associated protein-like protein [Frankiales bacterium]